MVDPGSQTTVNVNVSLGGTSMEGAEVCLIVVDESVLSLSKYLFCKRGKEKKKNEKEGGREGGRGKEGQGIEGAEVCLVVVDESIPSRSRFFAK